MTSRNLPETQKIMSYLGDCATATVEIPISNTMKDIKLFVTSRMKHFPIDSDTDKEDLSQQILERSGGSFLWVRLVMDELESVYGYESMLEIIQNIPQGMIGYYARASSDMAANEREKHISQAILLWVVLAARPLTVFELSHALELDINVHLPSAKHAIEGLCGNLVSVDRTTGIVHMVHSTAREFLLTDDAGEFQIHSSEAHEQIALVCLRLLANSSQMKPPRNRQLLNQRQPEQPTPALLDYAVTQFSEHVCRALVESDELLMALNGFLSTTVLSWLEKVVGKDLYQLIRTAKNVKAYLVRRVRCHAPLNQHVQKIDSWATDISRLAAKFGTALISSPSAIHFLIPPLCPTQSAIYQQFGSRLHDGLLIVGNCSLQWDDCVSTIAFENEAGAAVAAGNNLIAVGFESGNIQLFNHPSCQKVQAIKQESWVDGIYFDPLGTYVVSCSRKFIFVWDLDGKLRWKARIRARCLLFVSSPGYLLAVTHQGYAFKWDIVTGEMLQKQSYRYRPPKSNTNIHPSRAPFSASISPGLEVLALAYRNSPICLFDVASGEFLAWTIDGCSSAASHLIFNPNPDVELLLVASDESHLALYDSWSGALVQSRESDNHTVLNAISCSPDGQTFATVDTLGNLRLWDFESLTTLYQVPTPGRTFRLLSFTSDGFNLVDIDDDEMRVWSPSALVRKAVKEKHEDVSTSDQTTMLPATEGQFEIARSSDICAVGAHSVLPIVFAGNQDGDVLLYSSNDGHFLELVYSHGAFVTGIALTNGNIIASSDINSVVQIWELDLNEGQAIKTKQLRYQFRLRVPIAQIIFDATWEHLLVSTATVDHIYSVHDGNLVGDLTFTPEKEMWRWAPLPASLYPERFALLVDGKLTTYSIENIASKTNRRELLLNYSAEPGAVITGFQSLILTTETEKMMAVLAIKQRYGSYISTSTGLVFQLPCIDQWDQGRAISPSRTLPSSVCKQFLGLRRLNNDILFLHQNHWIASIDPVATSEQYAQHFIVPTDFIPPSLDIVMVQTMDEGFVFCIHDKLTIVKNGMTFAEPRTLG